MHPPHRTSVAASDVAALCLLGLPSGAYPTTPVLTKAYRAKALECHPDRQAGGSDTTFKKVREAFDALTASIRRHEDSQRNSQGFGATRSSATAASPSTPLSTAPGLRRPSSFHSAASNGSAPGSPMPPASPAAGEPSPYPASTGQPFASFPALLRSGTIYDFDRSPKAFAATKLRHGDVVEVTKASGAASVSKPTERTPHGALPRTGDDLRAASLSQRQRQTRDSQGTNADEGPGSPGTATSRGKVIGVAYGGMVYWWKTGATFATPFARVASIPAFRKVNTGMKDVVSTAANTSSYGTRKPHCSAGTPPASTSTHAAPGRTSTASSGTARYDHVPCDEPLSPPTSRTRNDSHHTDQPAFQDPFSTPIPAASRPAASSSRTMAAVSQTSKGQAGEVLGRVDMATLEQAESDQRSRIETAVTAWIHQASWASSVGHREDRRWAIRTASRADEQKHLVGTAVVAPQQQ